MGMDTQFYLNVKLKLETPENILNVLRYMCAKERREPPALPDHALFKTAHWERMFDGGPLRILHEDMFNYGLIVLSNFKNYDNEIKHIMHWLFPWFSYTGEEFLGFELHECVISPILYYYASSGITGIMTCTNGDTLIRTL